MKAVTFSSPGPAEVLEWSEVPDVEPAAGEVLVAVAASAVNRADLLQRQGHYSPPPGASPYLGLECSGRIDAFGPNLPPGHGWNIGDEVFALLTVGGYDEQVAVLVV